MHDGYSDRVVLLCSTPAAEAVSPGRMISSMQTGMCPEDASAVVIYFKDPFAPFTICPVTSVSTIGRNTGS
jgi:hypothetical protein